MSIRKRRWGQNKIAWQVDIKAGQQRFRKQFETRAEAQAYETDLRTKIKAGTFAPAGAKKTLRDLIPAYEAHMHVRLKLRKRMQKATMKCQLGIIRNWVIGGVPFDTRYAKRFVFKHGIGDIKLDQITPRSLEHFFDQVILLGRTSKTVREIRNALSNFLEFARREGYVTLNAAKGFKILSAESDTVSKEIAPPPKVLIAALLEKATVDHRDFTAIMFAAFTGLRASEQWALRWSHIDFDRGYVLVATRVDRFGDENGPKTRAGNREVPLSAELLKNLRRWREISPAATDDDLIFPGRTRKYMGHHGLKKRFAKYCKLAMTTSGKTRGRAPSIPRWHDLRHFAISCWIEAGLPPKAIQTFAGHADLATTMSRYGHLFPSETHREAMNGIITSILGTPKGPMAHGGHKPTGIPIQNANLLENRRT